MEHEGLEPVAVEERVDGTTFLLEIPPAAIAKAAATLGIEVEGDPDENPLVEALRAEARRIVSEAGEDYDWKGEGFRWDGMDKCWRRTYAWSQLEPLLQQRREPRAADAPAVSDLDFCRHLED